MCFIESLHKYVKHENGFVPNPRGIHDRAAGRLEAISGSMAKGYHHLHSLPHGEMEAQIISILTLYLGYDANNAVESWSFPRGVAGGVIMDIIRSLKCICSLRRMRAKAGNGAICHGTVAWHREILIPNKIN